jgi:hypothetical protein
MTLNTYNQDGLPTHGSARCDIDREQIYIGKNEFNH